MIFNSYIFVLCFLPLVVILYYSLNRVKLYFLSKLMLTGASLFFVGYKDRNSLYFLMASAVLTWVLGRLLLKWKHLRVYSRIFLGTAVFLQVAVLGYYKYTSFLIPSFKAGEILIPMGISFITFQQIAFLVDLYRGEIKQLSFWDYIFYICYFPKLAQGPITKYEVLVSQINDPQNRKVHMERLSYGLWLFATGLARKVLVADVLSRAVAWGYGSAIESITSMDALIVTLCFTLQIYFDFSGYSHMALGISQMLNLRLPDNFDAPYRSTSIIGFWKWWHISLTAFLREYLYFPLGGSKKGKWRTYLNTMIVFLVSGLWHGAAWNFVFWGGLHGIAQCLNKAFQRQWEKLHTALRWLLTFVFVNTAWIFFRAESVSQAWAVIQKILRLEPVAVSQELTDCFALPEFEFLAGRFPAFGDLFALSHMSGMLLFMIPALALGLCVRDRLTVFKPSLAKGIATVLLLGWSVVSFSTVVEFIYGGF